MGSVACVSLELRADFALSAPANHFFSILLGVIWCTVDWAFGIISVVDVIVVPLQQLRKL